MTKEEAKDILLNLLQEESDLSDGLSDEARKACDENVKALNVAILALEGITRAEFFDYAESHGFVVWSKECSDKAMNTIDKLEKIHKLMEYWNDMNSFDSMCEIKEVLDGQK